MKLLDKSIEVEELKSKLREFTVIFDLDVSTLGNVKRSALTYAKSCIPQGLDRKLWNESPVKKALMKGFIMGAKTEHAHYRKLISESAKLRDKLDIAIETLDYYATESEHPVRITGAAARTTLAHIKKMEQL